MSSLIIGLWILGFIFAIALVWKLIRTWQQMKRANNTREQTLASVFVFIACAVFVVYAFRPL
jgi:hypothetical protein